MPDVTLREEHGFHPRVLVADGDEGVRLLYRTAFQPAGYDVVEAADGREALTKALVRQPSLVVTELQLPLIDGFSLCEILRRDRMTAGVPILVVTSETSPETMNRACSVADAVLVKPITPEAVRERAARLVARSNELLGRGTTIRETASAQLDVARGAVAKSRERRRTAQRRRAAKARAFSRVVSTAPPAPPPALLCPSCAHPLTYECSHVGGVSEEDPERWDYFSCASCGVFQYRHRTRRLRAVSEDERRWIRR